MLTYGGYDSKKNWCGIDFIIKIPCQKREQLTIILKRLGRRLNI